MHPLVASTCLKSTTLLHACMCHSVRHAQRRIACYPSVSEASSASALGCNEALLCARPVRTGSRFSGHAPQRRLESIAPPTAVLQPAWDSCDAMTDGETGSSSNLRQSALTLGNRCPRHCPWHLVSVCSTNHACMARQPYPPGIDITRFRIPNLDVMSHKQVGVQQGMKRSARQQHR